MRTCLNTCFILLSFALMSCSQEQRQQEPDITTQAEQTSIIPTEANLTPDSIPCTWTIGFDVWEPYQYLDVNHVVSGLDIELISRIAKDINCEIDFVQGTWVSLLDDLKGGEVDLLLGASKTQAREKFAYFSEPYRTEEFVLYIRKDDEKSSQYNDINDFIEHDAKIGVVSSYFYGDEISVLLDSEETQPHFVFGIMGEMNIARLLDLDIDAFLEDSYVGASMLRRKGLGELIVQHGYTVNTGDIYVMFSQDSVQQSKVDEFNEALNTFVNSTEYVRLMTKYRN